MKHFSSLLLSVLVAFALVGCKNEYRKVIPSDAVLVSELNLGKMAVKADLPNQKEAFMQFMQEVQMDNELLEEVQELVNNPRQTGIDFMNPMYAFVCMIDKQPTPFFLMPVSNKKKLIDALDDDDYKLTFSEEDKMTFFRMDSEFGGVITDKVLLMGMASSNTLKQLLSKENTDNNFFDTEAGQFMNSHKGDIALEFNAAAIPANAKEVIWQLIVEEDQALAQTPQVKEAYDKLMESQLMANLNFDKGAIRMGLFARTNEDIVSYNAKKIDEAYFDYLPSEQLLCVAALGLDGAAYWQMAGETLKPYMEGEMAPVMQVVADYIQTLNGTAAVAAYAQESIDDPSVTIVLPSPKKAMDEMLNAFEEEMPRTLAYAGDEKITVISTDKNYQMQKNTQRPYKVKGSDMLYAYANMSLFTDIVEKEVAAQESGRANYLRTYRKNYYESLINFFRQADYVELNAERNNELNLTLTMTDNTRNALAIVVARGLDVLTQSAKR